MDKSAKRNASIVRTALLTATAAFVIASCSDDDERVYVYHPANSYVSMGVANGEGQIRTDKGNTLIPDESSVKRDLTEGERVFLRCSLLGEEGRDTFRVRVSQYYQLLAKDLLLSSRIDEDTLGNHPIDVERSWFGGGYLNMRIALMHNSSTGISHHVNLVYDESASSADTLLFTLRHNANGDTEHTVKGTAYASFNLKDLPVGDLPSKVYVMLRWRWYNSRGNIVEYEDGGYHTLSDESGRNAGHDEGNPNIE